MESMSTEPGSLVRQTLECLEAENVPSDLRAVAFAKVFDLLSGVSLTSAAPEPPSASTTSGSGGKPVVASDDWLEKISSRLGVSREQVEGVFFLDGDKLELVVGHARFDTAKSRATEQIALLVSAGRQAAGL